MASEAAELKIADATAIASAAVRAMPPPGSRILLEEKTVEAEFGWVFFYTTRRYQETSDPADLVPGDSPFVVDRSDGAIHFLSSSMPPAAAIEAYSDLWKSRQKR
ncbi:MAG TPA: YrhB domain-containing protein [Candidatus Binatia bacterium]|nr:YrhB domain-containing protein [Candidatus Binatia bacterium]